MGVEWSLPGYGIFFFLFSLLALLVVVWDMAIKQGQIIGDSND